MLQIPITKERINMNQHDNFINKPVYLVDITACPNDGECHSFIRR